MTNTVDLKSILIDLGSIQKSMQCCLLMACDFQQCGILTSVDSDELVQPPFKLTNAKCCSDCSLTVKEYSRD